MGIGGINSCVISRAWDPAEVEAAVAPKKDESLQLSDVSRSE
jgi:hypothetical protein